MYKDKFTKEQKAKYFQSLRNRWTESKKMAENDEALKAVYREVQATTEAKTFSYYSFAFCFYAMRAAGFSGVPYVDCKTFPGWTQSGYKVKKGEHSKISGLVWLHPKTKDEDGEEETEDTTRLYPKVYHLFHESQVERQDTTMTGEVVTVEEIEAPKKQLYLSI